MPYDEHGYCTSPDRDVPKIVCGYPRPCPHHTVTINPNGNSTSIPKGLKISQSAREKISKVSKALKDK